ncbi:MAG TPA: L-threonylcarbamoyladenylate synthase [bacterium]|nr:L-threonylcarbamoyladenylate synthase [bacterium]
MTAQPSQLEAAADILRHNGVAVFPTDTVYGIGAALGSTAGIRKLYACKKRPLDQPTAVLISSVDQLQELTDSMISGKLKLLLADCWPGALTIILPQSRTSRFAEGLKLICGSQGKIGIRLPDHDLTRSLISMLDEPLVASSANTKGALAPTARTALEPELEKAVDIILDGTCGSGISSTVLDLTTTPYTIIRAGEVTAEQISRYLD